MANPLDNLKPFPKGVSGNPKGNALDKHSTKSIASWINQLLNDETFKTHVREGLEIKEYQGVPIKAIIGAQIHLAINGDSRAADLLFKHGGTQSIDITSDGEKLEGSVSAEQLAQIVQARAGRADT